jgi:MFS family permease
MSGQPGAAAKEWRAHWPVVLSGGIGLSFFSVVTYSLGMFIGPLEKEFGWSRALISFGLSIFSFVAFLGGPFVGALIDRYGARRIAIPGMALSAAAFAGFSLANGSEIQWYVLWVIYGLMALAIKTTVWSAAVSSLFKSSRGLALALMLSGSALGQSLAPLTANWLINSHGWREAYRWIGGGWGGLALVLILLFFVDARGNSRRSGTAEVATSTLPGITVREALRNAPVLRICIANLFLALLGSGVSVHLAPILIETGLTRSGAAEIAATAGIAGIAGKLITGWLLDRVQGSIVPVSSFLLQAIGFALLLNRLHSPTAVLLGVLALGYSSGAGLQVSTYLISRYAGLRNFGKIYGTLGSMLMLGTGIGPIIAGRVHDVTGHYTVHLLIAIPVALISAFAFAGLGPYPTFADRALVTKAEPAT